VRRPSYAQLERRIEELQKDIEVLKRQILFMNHTVSAYSPAHLGNVERRVAIEGFKGGMK
jgi:hypothetical protein